MKVLCGVAVALAILTSATAWADSASFDAAAHNEAAREAIAQEEQKQSDLTDSAAPEVSQGFDEVLAAIGLLEKGTVTADSTALKRLQTAISVFDAALAAEPSLRLAPVDRRVTLHELETSVDLLQAQIEKAKKLLEDGQVQAARSILLPLRDDMEISTVYLPMRIYPDSIRLAVGHLRSGNREEAIAVLSTASGSLITESTRIPLGLIRARSLVELASTKDRSTDREYIQRLIRTAGKELQLVALLGYVDRNAPDYTDLRDQIGNLSGEIERNNDAGALYEQMETSFSDMIGAECRNAPDTAGPGVCPGQPARDQPTGTQDE